MKLLLVAVLVVAAAQMFPSCGGQDQGSTDLIGWVEAKRFDRADGVFMLTINGHEYVAPFSFWQTVRVGDLVKWDGTTWSIVRRAGSLPSPARTSLVDRHS